MLTNECYLYAIFTEVVEHTCGAATLMMGETSENLANSLDTYSYKQPLGVCAGICPFNFPAMIPLWMFPVGIVAGNTYILKPSEKDPGAAMILARLAQEAGLPDGVLNVIHGAHVSQSCKPFVRHSWGINLILTCLSFDMINPHRTLSTSSATPQR